jgi:hypothetical protein
MYFPLWPRLREIYVPRFRSCPPSQRAYKCLNEDNREGIVQRLWNSSFAAVKRLPGQHRALSSTNTTAMRSRDPIVTIAHPASTIRPGLRVDFTTLLSCKPIWTICPGDRTEQSRGKHLHLNWGRHRVGSRPENRVFSDLSWSASFPQRYSLPILLNSQPSYNSTLETRATAASQ